MLTTKTLKNQGPFPKLNKYSGLIKPCSTADLEHDRGYANIVKIAHPLAVISNETTRKLKQYCSVSIFVHPSQDTTLKLMFF